MADLHFDLWCITTAVKPNGVLFPTGIDISECTVASLSRASRAEAWCFAERAQLEN